MEITLGLTTEVHELGGLLRGMAGAWAAGDEGYDEAEAAKLRHRAIELCHTHYHRTIPAYRRLCEDAGVGDEASLDTIVELCMVTDSVFKSYDSAWVDGGNFAAMGEWLADICAEPVPPAAAEAANVDDWLARLEEGGLHVLYSSGTSGKLSFVPRAEDSWNSYRANGPSYLMHRVIDLGVELPSMHGAVLGFRGGRMGAQRAGVELARLIPSVQFLYDHEIRAEMLRTILSERRQDEARATRRATEAAWSDGRESSYERFLAGLGEATARDMSVWLFGSPYQVKQLCRLAISTQTPPLLPGSVVSLGGGWKSFEGERITRDELAELIERAMGITSERVLEAYSMVELNTPMMSCREKRFHVPPIVEPVAMDEGLFPLPRGHDVAGEFGFLDPTCTSFPSFLVTGDQVRLTWSCPCGLSGPAIAGEITRAPGREVRGCGGVMATMRA